MSTKDSSTHQGTYAGDTGSVSPVNKVSGSRTPQTTSTPQAPTRTARRTARRAQIQQNGRFVQGQNDRGVNRDVVFRITGFTKFAMLMVALILDLLPLIAVFALVVFVITSLGVDMDTVQSCVNYSKNGFWFGDITDTFGCAWGGGKALVAGTATLWFFGPIVYGITSLILLLLAPLVFSVWFWVKKVPYFSTKNGRAGALFLTFLIECIPFTSFLPGITFSTWKMIHISRKEDAAFLA